MTGSDMAQTSGPNASLDFGQATKMKDLVREGGGLATGGSPLAPTAPGGPPPPGPQQAEPQARMVPPFAKPPPMQGSPFVQQQMQPPQDAWRERLIAWSKHPLASRELQYLAHLATLDGVARGRTGPA
jgi:hypothetical protein